mgnify:CR=1 FL=1
MSRTPHFDPDATHRIFSQCTFAVVTGFFYLCRLSAYGRSVAHFPTAVKEFEWRNGWFHKISERALAKGEADPMPIHTAGLQKMGVVA